ncbi:hypothetical protein MMC09_006470 [Bachmanniomyces sp. S44760]|nr:hypothetical protein [Bachmanniomyces sp. S44760]
MGKKSSKKDGPKPNLKPEYVLPVKKPGDQPQKKKKKNAPDRPQPTWLFPQDDENPVLNPKPKSDEQQISLEQERAEAVDYLKHKAVTAPTKPAPPTQLLTLVGAFLSSYGFNSTSRIFTVERNARKKLNGWDDHVGAKLDKAMPNLVKIYKAWQKEYEERRELNMTSSDEDDDAATKRAKTVKRRQDLADGTVAPKADQTSSSGSSSDEGDENSEEIGMDVKAKATKPKKSKISSSSTSSSTSDSDADDEEESQAAMKSTKKPTVNGLVKSLKRTASLEEASSSSAPPESEAESEDSFDSDDSDSDAPAKKKKKTHDSKAKKSTRKTAKSKVQESSDSSSDDSSSDEVSDKPQLKEAKSTSVAIEPIATIASKTLKPQISSSESSETLNNSSPKKTSASDSGPTSRTSSSTSSSDDEAPKRTVTTITTSTITTKRKRSASPAANVSATNLTTKAAAKLAKKENRPFSRIPQDIKVDAKLSSNAYVPYDYAERAHQDLIVTKGKDFTKEKNKKKRGAYRGGMIETTGGKGIKFDESGN